MDNGYNSWKAGVAWSQEIPHYYGDYVRSLFIATAILSLLAMPMWGDLLPFSTVLQVAAALLLVLLAGLTSARNVHVMIANATIAAVSVVLLEYFAIVEREIASPQLFIAREAAVLLMLASLYFSVKTVRAMMDGKLGQADTPLEFEEIAEPEPKLSRPGDFDGQ